MIGARAVVTSSGFVFEKQASTVVVSGCKRRAASLAVLEYLREVDPGPGPGPGKIASVACRTAGGRRLQVVALAFAGGARTLTFDVGPSLFGRVRPALEVVNVAILVIAAAAALGAVGYLATGLIGH